MVILISMIHHCSADGYKVFLNSSLIPGLGRSAREGIDYPLQYSWASLVAQLVKNPPALQETWFGKISWRRERLPTPVFWCGEFHGLYSPQGRKQSDPTEQLSLTSLYLTSLRIKSSMFLQTAIFHSFFMAVFHSFGG